MFNTKVLVLIGSYLAIVLIITLVWQKILSHFDHKYGISQRMHKQTFQFVAAVALGLVYLFIQASLMIPTYGVDEFFHMMREFYGYVMIVALLAITYRKSYFAVTLLFAGILTAIADIAATPTQYLYISASYSYSYFQIAIIGAAIVAGIALESKSKTKKT